MPAAHLTVWYNTRCPVCDVAIAIWRATPGEGWIATLLGNPVMLPLTRLAYDRFADLLFAWNRRRGRW